jgi:hypothetical protein
MKKGGTLALLLLSLWLSVSSSGLVSANSSASHAPLKGRPSVYVNPTTVKETLDGNGAFILYADHLARMAPYTIASEGLEAFCAADLGDDVTTDLEGNFMHAVSVGPNCIPGTYHISVMQTTVHTLYGAKVTIKV